MPKPPIDFPRRQDHIDTEHLDALIQMAIDEDINHKEDVTSASTFSSLENNSKTARIIAKQAGIVCGVDAAVRVFQLVDTTQALHISKKVEDGDAVNIKDVIMEISGPPAVITLGERIALNFMGLMSGIATRTHNLVQFLEGTPTRLLDTRKTIPGLRQISKYSVLKGGGHNHRLSLDDMVLIKENHIRAVGSLEQAVANARNRFPDMVIELEVETLEQVRAALNTSADILMLDNMDNDTVKKAVAIVGDDKYLEVSGNITGDRLRSLGEIGVDFVSMGALTHTVTPLDISLLMEE